MRGLFRSAARASEWSVLGEAKRQFVDVGTQSSAKPVAVLCEETFLGTLLVVLHEPNECVSVVPSSCRASVIAPSPAVVPSQASPDYPLAYEVIIALPSKPPIFTPNDEKVFLRTSRPSEGRRKMREARFHFVGT